MRATNMKKSNSKTRLLLAAVMAVAMLLTATAFAAAPGITGPTFNLQAAPAYITQPDGSMVYSWGYGCNGHRLDLRRLQSRPPSAARCSCLALR